MFRVGFVSPKGGTGKTVLAVSAVLYLDAVIAPAGLVDTSPAPMGALMLGAEPKPGVYGGREEIPVAVTSLETLADGYDALYQHGAVVAVVDLPPMAKTPRLDVAVVVADPPGLRFVEEFKVDATYVILAVNMADKVEGYKNAANAVVALPYSPGVARAYQMGMPPILVHHPKAHTLAAWKRSFLKLMEIVVKEIRR